MPPKSSKKENKYSLPITANLHINKERENFNVGTSNVPAFFAQNKNSSSKTED